MVFRAGCFFVMLVVGGIAFPLNEKGDMSRFFDNPVDPLIIGGKVAGPVAHMVGLTTNIIAKSLVCGGSIINNRLVLTAAHCITSFLDDGSLLRSLRGNLGSNQWATSPIEHRFSHAINHPDYDEDLIKNDIGILVTVSAISFTHNIQPIVLNFDFISGGASAIANGWGRLVDGGPASQILMELRPLTVDSQRCVAEVARVAAEENIEVPPVEPEIQICTFIEKNIGMCHGDSGSALVLQENNQQIGIASWAVPCALGAPDMFVRVSAYKSWIEQQIQEAI